MQLTPGCSIGTAEVEAICRIDDHAYRNRWIVYAYHELSRNLRPLLGDNATFCTFATWSSRVIGEQIRTDVRNRRLARKRLPRGLNWLREPFINFERRWRQRTHSSVSQVMGYGNRMVFHEIAYELSRFVQEYGPTGSNPSWTEYRKAITGMPATQLFPAADPEHLREGIHCYYLAKDERDRARQAELVFRGTLLIGSYEQARVDVVLKAALSLFPRRLLRVGEHNLLHVSGCTGTAGNDIELRRREQPWALRHKSWWRRYLSGLYARVLTRFVISLEVPAVVDVNDPRIPEADTFEELRVGRGLNQLPGEPLYLAPLGELRDVETDALFDSFDRSNDTAEGCRARNWAEYNDRMNYIANFFRARQGSPLLFAALPREYRIVLDMDVSDDSLDELRNIGDDEAEDLTRSIAALTGLGGRDLLPKLIQFGLGPAELTKAELPALLNTSWYGVSHTLPTWADQETLAQGQNFFQRFKVEIASALFNASLPKSYTAARGARVLTQTADRIARSNNHIVADELVSLVTNVERRIAETGQMLLDVMGTEDNGSDAFSPQTHAYQAARGVRLFHAAVRDQLLQDDEGWDTNALGKPINQEDLLGTLTVFTVVTLEAMYAMGVRFTREDRDAYVHTWLVIGHLMGIEYERLFPKNTAAEPAVPPLSYEELQVVLYRVFTRQGGSSLDGRRLQQALLDVHRARLWGPFKGLPATSIRYLLGDEVAKDLGVPPSNWTRHLLPVLVPFNTLRTYAYHWDWFAWVVRRRSYRLYRSFIENARGDRPTWRMRALLSRRSRRRSATGNE